MTTSSARRTLIGGAALAAALALALGGAVPAAVAEHGDGRGPAHDEWRALAPAGEPESNPLKGFIPFAGDYPDFPHSMEWSYFPLNAVMTGPSTFDWTTVEATLDEVAARGHQTTMRFYLDYPQRESGIPQFLLDGGLETYPYTEFGNSTSVIPDYDDPNLIAALDAFVAEFGARYDGDPRLGFVQAGLIGFWGEWHTWPYNGEAGLPDRMPTAEHQADVLADFIDAFEETDIEVRYPSAANANLDVGYHDDSFALTTKPSPYGWYFMDQMIAAGATEKWKTNSIGGELRPELQSCIFSEAGCPVIQEGGDNDFAGSVEVTHASWLINHYAFATGYTGADRQRAIDGARSLGYSLRVVEAAVEAPPRRGDRDDRDDRLDVAIAVENVGIAPFAYDWPITIALADSRGRVVEQWTSPWTLDQVASGEQVRFEGDFGTSGVRPGRYTVLVQGTNPLATGQPVRFANADQDASVDGWLSIGSTVLTR
ncbi:DUF4832 domain-containing protein [Agromyces sp. CFH 90414]|uniref:DUF4832 domain-containing protein n=1 Tax=Agromyces agglutinans TaxID=2662258 RepID=A0A6I2F5E8_9MICO|nr:DUF4832 domain-containing protein [Agromyces agglutinans]MRG58947.1 DUF4832 domain-containing protein [Agromyces agglutinans]